MARVLVIGAGVVGLTCAVRLLEDGHQVDIIARDLPLETTSAVSAAFWYPYLAKPLDRVTAWSKRTYDVFAELAADESEAGVAMSVGIELLSEWAEPWWAGAVPSYRRVDDVPAPYAVGLELVAPIVEMPIYLRWLAKRVAELGGTITRLALSGLPDHAELVVNATGLGSRLMADDVTVEPVRGQVVVVSQVGLDRWWLDESGPTYIVPRSNDIVIGGTDERGDWDRTPRPDVAKRILDRAITLVPELKKAEVLQHKVGLRPARPEVRLERVERIIHCYGHGGAGVTVSWGCADEVVALASA